MERNFVDLKPRSGKPYAVGFIHNSHFSLPGMAATGVRLASSKEEVHSLIVHFCSFAVIMKIAFPMEQEFPRAENEET